MRGVFVIFLVLFSISLIFGNSSGKETRTSPKHIKINSTIVAADYQTLGDCLAAIQESTGSTLNIITEKPSQISGFLSNGEQFACVEKVSDEKGTYVDGWYTLK